MFNLSSKFQEVLQKWRPFQATDFQSLMYVCHILGIFSYKINISIFEMSKPCYILSTVTCVVCAYQFMLLYDTNILGKVDFGDTPMTLEGNFYYVFSCFIAIVTYILSEPRMYLLQTIMDVSSKLSLDTYKKTVKTDPHKRHLQFLLRPRNHDNNIQQVKDWPYSGVVRTIRHISGILENMLYLNCVCILTACFKKTNDNLANLELLVKDVPCVFSQINREIYFY